MTWFNRETSFYRALSEVAEQMEWDGESKQLEGQTGHMQKPFDSVQ